MPFVHRGAKSACNLDFRVCWPQRQLRRRPLASRFSPSRPRKGKRASEPQASGLRRLLLRPRRRRRLLPRAGPAPPSSTPETPTSRKSRASGAAQDPEASTTPVIRPPIRSISPRPRHAFPTLRRRPRLRLRPLRPLRLLLRQPRRQLLRPRPRAGPFRRWSTPETPTGPEARAGRAAKRRETSATPAVRPPIRSTCPHHRLAVRTPPPRLRPPRRPRRRQRLRPPRHLLLRPPRHLLLRLRQPRRLLLRPRPKAGPSRWWTTSETPTGPEARAGRAAKRRETSTTPVVRPPIRSISPCLRRAVLRRRPPPLRRQRRRQRLPRPPRPLTWAGSTPETPTSPEARAGRAAKRRGTSTTPGIRPPIRSISPCLRRAVRRRRPPLLQRRRQRLPRPPRPPPPRRLGLSPE